jgi:hypothetical protein
VGGCFVHLNQEPCPYISQTSSFFFVNQQTRTAKLILELFDHFAYFDQTSWTLSKTCSSLRVIVPLPTCWTDEQWYGHQFVNVLNSMMHFLDYGALFSHFSHRSELFESQVVQKSLGEAFHYMRIQVHLVVQQHFFVRRQWLVEPEDWLSTSAGASLLDDVICELGKRDRSTLALDSLIVAQVWFHSITSIHA